MTEMITECPWWLAVIYLVISLALGIHGVINIICDDRKNAKLRKESTKDFFDTVKNQWGQARIDTILMLIILAVVGVLVFIVSLAPQKLLKKL